MSHGTQWIYNLILLRHLQHSPSVTSVLLTPLLLHLLRASRESHPADLCLFVVSSAGSPDIAQVSLELVIVLFQSSEYGVIDKSYSSLLERVLATGINGYLFLSNC